MRVSTPFIAVAGLLILGSVTHAVLAAEDVAVIEAVPVDTTVQTAVEPAAAPLTTLPSESSIPELLIYSEETMVTSATKRLQKLSEVPGSVTLITEQEIRERGALTLSDLLINVMGTELTHEGLFETVRFRGMQSAYNNKILVLLNGRKLNTIDWGNFNDSFGNNLDNIRQIEIIKGPGSALYGANAFAGVISLITKDGKDLRGLSTKLSFGTKTGDEELSRYLQLTYGYAQGDWDLVGTAGYWVEHGVDLINAAAPNDRFEGDRFDVTLKYQDLLRLNAGFAKSEEPYPGLFFAPTPKARARQDVLYLDAKVTLVLDAPSLLTWRVQDSYYLKREIRNYGFTLDRTLIATPADLPSEANLLIDDDGKIRPAADAVGMYYIGWNDAVALLSGRSLHPVYWTGPMNEFLTEVQYDLDWPKNNYLIGGASFTHDWSGQDYFDAPSVSDQNYAAYVQDEYHALDTLIFLAGVRYDHNTGYGSDVSPRGSVIFTPVRGLRVKALYGSAFRAPVFLERYTRTRVGFVNANGNPDLEPEQTKQGELSLEYELGKWLQVRGGAFYWETHNEIQPMMLRDNVCVLAPDLSLVNPSFPHQSGLYYSYALNQASATIDMSNNNSRTGKGVEAEVVLRPLPLIKVGLNYAHFDLYLNQVEGDYIVDPGYSDLANGLLGFNYENRFFLNVYAHLGYLPRTVEFDPYYSQGGRVENIWLNQFDVTAGVRFKGVNLTLSVFNVLENDIMFNQTNASYVKGPRVLRLTAEYTYAF